MSLPTLPCPALTSTWTGGFFAGHLHKRFLHKQMKTSNLTCTRRHLCIWILLAQQDVYCRLFLGLLVLEGAAWPCRWCINVGIGSSDGSVGWCCYVIVNHCIIGWCCNDVVGRCCNNVGSGILRVYRYQVRDVLVRCIDIITVVHCSGVIAVIANAGWWLFCMSTKFPLWQRWCSWAPRLHHYWH